MTTTPTPEDRPWSYTRLTTYRDCPAHYKATYVDHKPRAYVAGFEFGTRVHAVIEEYTKHLARTGQTADLRTMAAIAERWDDEEVTEVCGSFAASHRFDWLVAGADVESAVVVALPDGYGQFRCHLDYWQHDTEAGTLRIDDYKTSWHVPNQRERAPLQLRSYAWAMLQAGYLADEILLQIDYVRRQVVHQWRVKPESLGMDWALRLIDAIHAETRWEALPGPHCAYCGYWRDCAACDPNRCGEDAAWRERAEWLVAMDEATKATKAALREHVSEHGPVPCGAGLWGDFPDPDAPTRYTWKRGMKGKVLERLGMPARFVGAVEGLDKEFLARCIPHDDDVFGGPQDDEGEDVDLSDLLVPMKPEKRWGYYSLRVNEESGPPSTEALDHAMTCTDAHGTLPEPVLDLGGE